MLVHSAHWPSTRTATAAFALLVAACGSKDDAYDNQAGSLAAARDFQDTLLDDLLAERDVENRFLQYSTERVLDRLGGTFRRRVIDRGIIQVSHDTITLRDRRGGRVLETLSTRDSDGNLVIDGWEIANRGSTCVYIHDEERIVIRNSKIGPCGHYAVFADGPKDTYTHDGQPVVKWGSTIGVCRSGVQNGHITVENNFIFHSHRGVHMDCAPRGHVRVEHNHFLNLQGRASTAARETCVDVNTLHGSDLGSNVFLFDVKGPGIRVASNYFVNELRRERGNCAVAFMEDNINIGHRSAGTPSDPLVIENNWGYGGNPDRESGGGYLLGDGTVSHAVMRNNVALNPGGYGIQYAGGHHVTLENNYVYAQGPYFLGAGVLVRPWESGHMKQLVIDTSDCTTVTVRGNQVNHKGAAYVHRGCATPRGWNDNQRVSLHARQMPLPVDLGAGIEIPPGSGGGSVPAPDPPTEPDPEPDPPTEPDPPAGSTVALKVVAATKRGSEFANDVDGRRAEFSVYVDGSSTPLPNRLTGQDRVTTSGAPNGYEFEVDADQVGTIRIEFLNDYNAGGGNDLNLWIDYVELDGVRIDTDDAGRVALFQHWDPNTPRSPSTEELIRWRGSAVYTIDWMRSPAAPAPDDLNLHIVAATAADTQLSDGVEGRYAQFRVYLNDEPTPLANTEQTTTEVTTTGAPNGYSFSVPGGASIDRIRIEFTNDYNGGGGARDLNLWVDYIRLEGLRIDTSDSSRVQLFQLWSPHQPRDTHETEVIRWNGFIEYRMGS